MKLEDGFGATVVADFDNAAATIRLSGVQGCCVMATKGRVFDCLRQAGLPFQVVEFIRSDGGIWSHEQNATSLPLGCLSSQSSLRHLQAVTVFRLIDEDDCWEWKSRVVKNCVVVRLYFSDAVVPDGFVASRRDVDAVAADEVVEELVELIAGDTMHDHSEIVIEIALMTLVVCGNCLVFAMSHSAGLALLGVPV